MKTLHATRYAAAAFWNKLPIAVKKSDSVPTFNHNLKSWLTKDYISSRENIVD